MEHNIEQSLLDRFEALARKVDEQQAEIDRLTVASLGAPLNHRQQDAVTPDEAIDPRGSRTSRRDLLVAGVGMAVAATAVSWAGTADADFRGTLIADAGNAYGGLGAAGGDPATLLPALGTTTHGLIGVADAGSVAPPKKSGVLGTAKTSVGVEGLSLSGVGVYGRSNSQIGVAGASIFKHGVRGDCTTTFGALDSLSVELGGVLGVSNRANGVVGVATGAAGAGVLAVSRNVNRPALAVVAANPSAQGAVITGRTTLNGSVTANGNLTVDGDLAVTGMKSAAVQHPDGTHRLVYCVEAPEAWLEDFGEGTVVDGRGEVTLDPEFAALCDTGTFHVFIAPHNDEHLHVARHDALGFTVQADLALAALKGKKREDLAGSFSYRVVGRRRDNPGTRLAPFALAQPDVQLPG